MPRRRRRLVNLVAVFTWLVWSLAVLVWVRTWFTADVVGFSVGGDYYDFQTSETTLRFCRVSDWRASTHPIWSSAPVRFNGVDGNPSYYFLHHYQPEENEELELDPLVGPRIDPDLHPIPFFNTSPTTFDRFGWRIRGEVVYVPAVDGVPLMNVPRRRATAVPAELLDRAHPHRSISVAAPVWHPVVIATIGPAFHLWSLRRARQLRRFRRANRLCLDCGYDLCESPLRCPECGRWDVRPTPSVPA